jgi:hypothetical protein
MDKWRVTFTKKIDFEINAETEDEALIEAMKLNLDSMPIEWEMEGPISTTHQRANSVEQVIEEPVELDSFGRPIFDLDGVEDEQDDLR